jgi:curli biogenesis system outer membrane secretion channel CsgG
MTTKVKIFRTLFLAIALVLPSCLSESEFTITPRHVNLRPDLGDNQKTWIALDGFKCHAGFVRSNSSKGQIQDQARAILLSHLQQTKSFRIQESVSPDVLKSSLTGQTVRPLKSPKYIVSGDIIEFGRKETGEWALWGLLTANAKQVAYAKVNLNILNASTSEVVYSVQGAGQFHFSQREYIAASFSGTSSFDWVISGKVLDLAIMEAVNRLSNDLARGNCRFD